MNEKLKEFFYLVFLFGLCFLLFKIEGKLNPSDFLNVDERLWIYRSQIYIENFINYNFVGGLQTIHPGITVMALSGLSIYIYTLYADTINGPMLLYFFNIPIIVYISLFFFILYFLLRKLKFDKSLSLLAVILIFSNSYYITSSSPVDKFSTMSILLSLLFLIVYVNKNYEFKKYLFLSSFFTSFAILSKLSALIVIPFSLFVLLYYSQLNYKKIRGAFNDYFYYLFYILIIALILFPGFIFNPILSLQKIFSRDNNVLISGTETERIAIPSLYEKMYKYLFIWESSIIAPVTLIFFILFLIFCFRKILLYGLNSKISSENIFYKNIFILLLFSIIYFMFITYFASLIFYRYMMLSAMIIDICAAIGIYKMLLFYKEKISSKFTINNLAVKFIVVFFLYKVLYLIMLNNFVNPVI